MRNRRILVGLVGGVTALATSIDGKVQYEMTQVQQPALKIYIDQLNDAIKKARTKGLIDP